MNKIKFLLVAGIFCLLSLTANAQQLAIKTNLLSDALMAPSLGFELVTGEHTSVDIQGMTTLNTPYHKNISLTMIQPEYRYWYAGRPMTRGFIGIAGTLAQYDATWKNTTYDGYAGGVGITMGYVFHLGSRMNIEFQGGVGAYYTHHKQFNPALTLDPEKETYHNAMQMLPTKFGISFVYILK